MKFELRNASPIFFNATKRILPATIFLSDCMALIKAWIDKFTFNSVGKAYNCNKVIPYLWMPKFSQTDDPSARLLDIYKEDDPEMKRWAEGGISCIIEPITEI